MSPSLAYSLTEKITATVGLNYYTGPFDGLIGEFHKSSNVMFRLKYGF
jgi:hypothetical protein